MTYEQTDLAVPCLRKPRSASSQRAQCALAPRADRRGLLQIEASPGSEPELPPEAVSAPSGKVGVALGKEDSGSSTPISPLEPQPGTGPRVTASAMSFTRQN